MWSTSACSRYRQTSKCVFLEKGTFLDIKTVHLFILNVLLFSLGIQPCIKPGPDYVRKHVK